MVANPEWSIKDAAAQSGRCRKRFAQLLRLSFLAPEIVKRIVEGHPADWIPRDLMEVALPAVGKRSRRCWVSLEGNRPAALRRRVEVSERELRLPSYKDNRLRKNRFGPEPIRSYFGKLRRMRHLLVRSGLRRGETALRIRACTGSNFGLSASRQLSGARKIPENG